MLGKARRHRKGVSNCIVNAVAVYQNAGFSGLRVLVFLCGPF